MPSSAKIKRGVGLLLLGGVGWGLLALLLVAAGDAPSDLVAVLALVASFAVFGCLVAGLALLIWGLLAG